MRALKNDRPAPFASREDGQDRRSGTRFPFLPWGGGDDRGVGQDRRRPDAIVAVGLLTQRDLDVLGSGFRRSFPVQEDTAFDDLLQALDSIEAIHVPHRKD